MWKPSRTIPKSLHHQIIQWITEQIKSGDWVVGTKLPTQRQLAFLLEVNRSTIKLALDELKADGILESRIGSGVFVANNSWNLLSKNNQPNWQSYIEASIHKPNDHTIQMINEYEQDNTVIRLGTGELSPSLLPTTKLQKSLQNLSFEGKDIGYSSPQGSEKLRQALCNYLSKRKITTTPENILIVSGALQALQLISLGLFEPGSIVFQEPSSYLNSIHPFQSFGMQLKSVSQEEMFKESLQKMKRNRQSIYYTIPTLNNPTGSVWSLEEKQNLYNLCIELRIPIIEDDVYFELLFDSKLVSPSIKSLDTSGQVLYIGSVSKTLSPGLRVGWIVGPTPVIKRLADIKMQMDYGTSAFSQEIVTHWLNSDLYENHLTFLREQLKFRATLLDTILNELFESLATWEKPKGGFYIWFRFNEPIVTKEFFLKLLQRKVLINPGYIYNSYDSHHIRLSYAYASLEELKNGIYILYEESILFLNKLKTAAPNE
ncbi:aminotransferase-like domain-containing protein [Rummeliibacillus sp. JY-2-4R]